MGDWARLEQWQAALAAEGRLAELSQQTYIRELQRFVAWATEQGLQTPDAVQADSIRAYVARRRGSGVSARSVQKALSALRHFFAFCIERGDLKDSPVPANLVRRHPRHLPKAVDQEPLNALLDAMPAEAPLDCRDRAVLELFYSAGLRLAELAALNVRAVKDLPEQLIVMGKGGRERMIYFGPRARTALAQWLRQRGQLAAPDEEALFVSQRGRRMSHRTIQARLAHWATALGLGQHLHPHMLRHSFASHVLQSSGDLRGVQELLGHKNLSTTQVYTRLDWQHLAKVYDAAHPRASKKTEPGSQ